VYTFSECRILSEFVSIHRLYTNLTTNSEWMSDLHAADAILVATHSQGSIVSTHLVERLIREKHIKTLRTSDLLASASAALAPGGTSSAAPSSQRVCCLALCGIHLGPLRYLSSSSLLQPYIQVGVSDSLYDMDFFLPKAFIYQYFESAAAKELFEFQVSHPTALLRRYAGYLYIHNLTRGRAPTVRLRKFTLGRCVMS
jgi:hypothetical protein